MSDTNRRRKTTTRNKKYKSNQFTTRLTDELQATLDRVAEHEERTASQVVRLALRQYFSKCKGAQ